MSNQNDKNIKPANPVEETRGRTITPLQIPKPAPAAAAPAMPKP